VAGVPPAKGDQQAAEHGQSHGDQHAPADRPTGGEPLHQGCDHRLRGKDGRRGDRAGIADTEGIAGGKAADAGPAEEQDVPPGQAEGEHRRPLTGCDDARQHEGRHAVAAGGDDEGRQILQQHRRQGHHGAPGDGREQQPGAGGELAARRGCLHLVPPLAALSAWSA